jgi:hypothetical protein
MHSVKPAFMPAALPYPKPRDSQCSGSYTQSGGFCIPKSGGTVRESIPKPRGMQCPSGWASSGDACEKMGGRT